MCFIARILTLSISVMIALAILIRMVTYIVLVRRIHVMELPHNLHKTNRSIH